jgi:hypothetical protein
MAPSVQRQKQIPFGNDNKKSKDNGKSRFPSGMTTRKAKATAIARATAKEKQVLRLRRRMTTKRQNAKSRARQGTKYQAIDETGPAAWTEESGRASLDAHISKSRYGAPAPALPSGGYVMPLP